MHNRITYGALVISALTVACSDQPSAVTGADHPMVKKVKDEGCVTSPTATLTLTGTVRLGTQITICAQEDLGTVSGSWSATPSYGGAVLDLVAPDPTASDPVGYWCVQMDYSATQDADLEDKNAFTWVRDVGNGKRTSFDEIATRRVDAAGASCAGEAPPPIPPAPCTDDPSVIGIECFTPVQKGDFRGTVEDS